MSTRSSICVRGVFSTSAAPLAACEARARAAARRSVEPGARSRVSPSLISPTSSPRLHTHTDDLNNTDHLEAASGASRCIRKKLNACRRPCAKKSRRAPPATGDTHDACPTLHGARAIRAGAASPVIHSGTRAHAHALAALPLLAPLSSDLPHARRHGAPPT